jgi:HSP20 family molecular chaperone IbpA
MRRAAFAPNLRGVDAQLERWLGESLQQSAARPAARPAVQQDDTAYTVSFDVPGVSKAQLSIGIEGKVVRIESLPDAPRAYKLAYELPQDIDVSSSEAKLDNGVLTLKLAKRVPPSSQLKID